MDEAVLLALIIVGLILHFIDKKDKDSKKEIIQPTKINNIKKEPDIKRRAVRMLVGLGFSKDEAKKRVDSKSEYSDLNDLVDQCLEDD